MRGGKKALVSSSVMSVIVCRRYFLESKKLLCMWWFVVQSSVDHFVEIFKHKIPHTPQQIYRKVRSLFSRAKAKSSALNIALALCLYKLT